MNRAPSTFRLTLYLSAAIAIALFFFAGSRFIHLKNGSNSHYRKMDANAPVRRLYYDPGNTLQVCTDANTYEWPIDSPPTTYIYANCVDYTVDQSTCAVQSKNEIGLKTQIPGSGPANWTVKQGIPLTAPLLGLRIAPDGTYVLGVQDRSLIIWDVSTRKESFRLSNPRTINAFDFSPESQLVAVALSPSSSAEPDVIIWDLLSRAPAAQLFGDKAVTAIAFSQDHTALALGYENGNVEINEWKTPHSVLSFAAHTGPVRSIAFNPNAKMIATGGDDKVVSTWNAQTGQNILTFPPMVPKSALYSLGATAVIFSQDGHFLIAGYGDGIAKCWVVK